MSKKELMVLVEGKRVENRTNWKRKCFSKAKGFCFEDDEMTLASAIGLNEFLGFYSEDYDFAVEFEVINPKTFKASEYGVDNGFGFMQVLGTELSAVEYSTADAYIKKVYDMRKLRKWYAENEYEKPFAEHFCDGEDDWYEYRWDIVDEDEFLEDIHYRVVR